MWTLVFLAGIFFSGYYCWQMWKKWEDSPVLMSLDSNRYPLKNIPFPAVTICNVNKVSKTKLLRVMEDPRSYSIIPKSTHDSSEAVFLIYSLENFFYKDTRTSLTIKCSKP
jgi:hypothetical protein